jgi:hypothetical protein
MKTWKRIAGLGYGATVIVGLACSDGGNKAMVAPPGAVDINGFTYNEIFTCNETFAGGTPICADNQAADVSQFTATGPSAFVGRDVPDTGFVYTGTMSGVILTWTAVSPNGYTESGAWTFSADGATFSGSSTYNANDASYSGRCNSTGARAPAVPAAPAAVAPCP